MYNTDTHSLTHTHTHTHIYIYIYIYQENQSCLKSEFTGDVNEPIGLGQPYSGKPTTTMATVDCRG